MSNKLSQSTSPYLLQHADNPVHWQEWGEDALAEARASGKPILLSIGYSACHWCHVMAHESFEDEGIAALMNELFVNIKVDREERPDLDQIYQSAHAMLSQRSGGWPLTMFLSADTTPFFGGTYFPKTPRYGLPGFGELLQRVATYHRERGADIAEQNGRLVAALQATASAGSPANGEVPAREVLERAWQEIHGSFDPEWGGFGRAPKFPHPEMIELCLRRHAATGDAEARHVAAHTLERMCRGGLYDQLGGGFARYSVDEEWAIPHFEKMLYDNGPLLRLLSDAALSEPDAGRRALFERCARGTAEWVCREMQSPAGGYYSTLDADSEGHEGKFYVWDRAAVKSILDDREWAAAAPHFALDGAPNFEGGSWHLLGNGDAADPAIESARTKLLAVRERRIRPGRDEKILVSWNALMIEGMARAALAFDSPAWLVSARRALDFVRTTMWDAPRGRLFATHKDGVSRLNAYLDDYAFLLKAVLAMIEADFRADEFAFGVQLADALLAHFEDADAGGFFFTSHDHEKLLQRTKPGFDNATPSGNGVAAFALQRWHHLTHDPRYEAAARRTLACFAESASARPSAHGSLLMALDEQHLPPSLLILQGATADIADWRRRLAGYRPRLMVLQPTGEVPPPLSRPPTDAVQAWLCHGTACLPPIGRFEELAAAL